MPKDVIQAPQNRLLASLAPADYDILRADLEPITLSYRTSLYKAKELTLPIRCNVRLDARTEAHRGPRHLLH